LNPVFFPAFGYISIKDTSPTIIPGEAGFGFQNCDDVDVVGHEAVGPDGEVVFLSLFFQDVQVCTLVAFLQEDVLSAISPLYDVMRDSGCNYPCDSSHVSTCMTLSPRRQCLFRIVSPELFYFLVVTTTIGRKGVRFRTTGCPKMNIYPGQPYQLVRTCQAI